MDFANEAAASEPPLPMGPIPPPPADLQAMRSERRHDAALGRFAAAQQSELARTLREMSKSGIGGHPLPEQAGRMLDGALQAGLAVTDVNELYALEQRQIAEQRDRIARQLEDRLLLDLVQDTARALHRVDSARE